MYRIFAFSFLLLSLLSCNEDSYKSSLPQSIGRTGEVVLVMSNELWNDSLGRLVDNALSAPVIGLPQYEPQYTILRSNPDKFNNVFKLQKTILHFHTDTNQLPRANFEKDGEVQAYVLRKDIYAKGQYIFYMNPYLNQDSMIKVFHAKSSRVIQVLDQMELNRLEGIAAKNSKANLVDTLQEVLDLKITLTKDFKKAVFKNDFAWFRSETSSSSSNILVYVTEYRDSTAFETSTIRKVRNNLGMSYVPGPLPGTYMTVEDRLPLNSSETQINGAYAKEVKGLWRLEGDFMGGPFVSYAVYDAERNRVIYLDGFVYAPEEDKRELMRNLIALMHTLKF